MCILLLNFAGGGDANLDMMFFVVTFAILRKWPARFLQKIGHGGLTVWTKN